MKICFLSFSHPYDYTRIYQMEARSLAESGFEVIIVAPGGRERFAFEGVRIELYPRLKGILGRVIRFGQIFYKALIIDAEFYHCNEVESWLVGVVLKLWRRDKIVVFDVKECYSSRFDESHVPKWIKPIAKPLLLFFFQYLPRWTDFFIFAKRGAAIDFSHLNPEKCAYIYHYGLLRMHPNLSDEWNSAVQKSHKIKKVAIHIGGISRARGWPQLLHALALMQNKNLEVLCFGNVLEGKNVLTVEATRQGFAHRVHLCKQVPYERVFEHIRGADVGLMLYQPDIKNHVYASPMKMWDYMLAGLPFIGPNFAVEVAPIVEELNCGLLIDTSSPTEIAKALDWICENPAKAVEMGQRGRKGVIEKYNWESEAEKLISIYNQLAAKINKQKRS
jgi:glycosyltransferase involved in cell wall biosynthesis